jgi:hypothetical protein
MRGHNGTTATSSRAATAGGVGRHRSAGVCLPLPPISPSLNPPPAPPFPPPRRTRPQVGPTTGAVRTDITGGCPTTTTTGDFLQPLV